MGLVIIAGIVAAFGAVNAYREWWDPKLRASYRPEDPQRPRTRERLAAVRRAVTAGFLPGPYGKR